MVRYFGRAYPLVTLRIMIKPVASQYLIWLALLIFTLPSVYSQTIWTDTFNTYPEGALPSDRWQSSRGQWSIVADGSNKQLCEESTTFDNGAFVPQFLDKPYIFETHFRLLSDYKGAGFLFNSASPTNASFAMMVRLDNDVVIYGYIENGEYQGLGEVKITKIVEKDKDQVMRLVVSDDSFNFSLNGIEILKDVPLVYKTGFAGVENSGSRACFDNTVLYVKPISAQNDNAAWVTAVAPADSGAVWLASPSTGRVVKLKENGDIAANAQASEGEPKWAVTSLLPLANHQVAALDTTQKKIHILNQDGVRIKSVMDGLLTRPKDMGMLADGSWVINEQDRVVVMDSTFAFKMAFAVQSPVVATHNNMLAYVDLDRNQIRIARNQDSTWTFVQDINAPFGIIRGLALTDSTVYVALQKQVLKLDWQGRTRSSLEVPEMGGITPQRLALTDQHLYITDFVGNRILVSDLALTSPSMTHTFSADKTSLEVQWNSKTEPPSHWELYQQNMRISSGAGIRQGKGYAATIPNSQPSSYYQIRYTPLVQSIPPSDGLSKPVSIMSPPPKGKMQYMEMNAIILLFTNVYDKSKMVEGQPEMPPLSKEEEERIRAQLQDARLFYWMNSGMKLHLKIDEIVESTPFERSQLLGNEWYYPPIEGKAEAILGNHGRNVKDYQAIFYLPVIREYDAASQQWRIRGGGGGFTNGMGWNGKYGRSWWEVTAKDHPAGNNWLFVHEFNHQLDELFQISGFPEYWFNHFTPHLGWAANFGEHFDGNAFILKNWVYDKWFGLKNTLLQTADDADGDGIPDKADGLPMDEARLHSNPQSTDTDADGVTDAEELATSNWVQQGWGETWAGEGGFPFPIKKDTDGDGINDILDQEPLYPFKTEINEFNQGFNLIGQTLDGRMPYKVLAAYTPDSLYLRIETKGKHLRILLDAQANGWFIGKDNVELKIDSTNTILNLFNASKPDAWPTMDKALAETIGFSVQVLPRDSGYALRIARNDKLGIKWERGKSIGLNIGVSFLDFPKGKHRYLTIHEPNRIIPFRLK